MNKTILLTAIFATLALAESPRTMLFQGSVSKNGAALTGNHKVAISICESSDIDDDNCTKIYTNDALPFAKGYYAVVLGETTPLPVFDKPYFLQVSIDGTTPDSRIPLTSSPSAMNAIRADSAKYAKLADSTAGGAKRADVATTAKSADLATQIPGVKSSKDSTYFSNAVLSFDDTTSFGSVAGTTEGKGLWNINTLLSKDTSNFTLRAIRSSVIGKSGSTSESSVSLTNRELELYVVSSGYSGTGGGGSISSILMKPSTIDIAPSSSLTITPSNEEVMTVAMDSTIVKNVFRTTLPAVLIIPTNSSICENDPCSIDGQIIIGTSNICNGGTSNYATANKMMVCRGHYGTSSMHWNHIE